MTYHLTNIKGAIGFQQGLIRTEQKVTSLSEQETVRTFDKADFESDKKNGKASCQDSPENI